MDVSVAYGSYIFTRNRCCRNRKNEILVLIMLVLHMAAKRLLEIDVAGIERMSTSLGNILKGLFLRLLMDVTMTCGNYLL